MSATVFACQECPAVTEVLADAEEHADTTGHTLVRGDIVEPERVGPSVYGSLSAPELALLRMALVLGAAGLPVAEGHLVERTVVTRGILLRPANRSRYRTHLANLVGAGYLRTTSSTEVRAWGDDDVTITARGRRALEQQVADRG